MAWHNEIQNEKTYTGSVQLSYPRRQTIAVASSRNKVEEIWSLLRYDALIDNTIEARLRERGVRTPARERILTELSSYIDQAENFYLCALGSDYRSAALLYYYAFLNLAKASIVVNKPHLANKKFSHGIKGNVRTGSLAQRSAIVGLSSSNVISVFNELYDIEYSTHLPNKSISLRDIIPYMTDISDETTKLMGVSLSKSHDSKLYMFTNDGNRKCWAVLVSRQGFYPANFPGAYRNFTREFQRFNPSSMTTQFVFDMNASQSRAYNFSQSIREFDLLPTGRLPVQEINELIKDSFSSGIQDNIFDSRISFSITDPLRKNWRMPFNEPIAIYFMMFYLSEVVRYNPGEFSGRFAPTSKEGWLIKSFIESTPYVALNYLIATITGKAYLIEKR